MYVSFTKLCIDNHIEVKSHRSAPSGLMGVMLIAPHGKVWNSSYKSSSVEFYQDKGELVGEFLDRVRRYCTEIGLTDV